MGYPRMFPNQGDADRSGNCPAGTTIDDGLGHPTEFDYYQLTHGGLIGTSRPAHYSVGHLFVLCMKHTDILVPGDS